MANEALQVFERIARRAHLFTAEEVSNTEDHPFEKRSIFEPLPAIVRTLFDNGHYAQTTFEAFKFLDREVARIAGISETGKSLMMKAFNELNPLIRLNSLQGDSEISEQEGYEFIFAGAILAIRNPRGHDYTISDTLDDCLDHLSFVSILLRRLVSAGFSVSGN